MAQACGAPAASVTGARPARGVTIPRADLERRSRVPLVRVPPEQGVVDKLFLEQCVFGGCDYCSHHLFGVVEDFKSEKNWFMK